MESPHSIAFTANTQSNIMAKYPPYHFQAISVVEVTEDEFPPCKNTSYGCCSDSNVPAHGSKEEGCCIDTEFGCCPDNTRAAQGRNGEGCDCQSSVHGCCPDGEVSAVTEHE